MSLPFAIPVRKRPPRWPALRAALLAALTGLSVALPSLANDPAEATAAEQRAKGAVLENLLSPSTAKFPLIETTANPSNPDGYLVTGQVDAENMFGAMMRSDYWVTLTPLCLDWADEACWRIDSVLIDRKPIRRTPL